MQKQLTIIQSAISLLLITVVVGCGDGRRFAPVSGRVTLGNEPLSDAYVVFEPVSALPDQVSQGQTDAQGRFVLASVAGQEGALVGRHHVRITTIPPNAMDDERSPLPKDRVPPKYRSEPLEFEVSPEGTDSADFVLAGK